MVGLERHIDYSLEQRLRGGISRLKYDDLNTQVMARLESLYNEMTDNDLSSSLSEFFNAWSELQAKPHDMSTRAVVAQVAEAMTYQIKTLRGDLINVYNDTIASLNEVVDQINFMAERLAYLNVQIANDSAAGRSPSALLDQRDSMLKELAELADIHTAQQPSGAMTVYLGAEPLVQYNNFRPVEILREGNGELIVPKVVFADTQGQATISAGKAGAMVYLIDDFVTGNLQQLDNLAGAIIFEVNRIHSSGQGLRGYDRLDSNRAVDDPTAVLNRAGLDMVPKNGSFVITVRDAHSNQSTVHQIDIDLNGLGSDTTLNDLVAQIDAIPTLRAQTLPNGRLQIEAVSDNYTFTFGQDDSYVLAALGLNSFFDGTTGADIKVNSAIVDSPALIAASRSNEPGDGSNAALIAQLRGQAVSTLNDVSIPEYYRAIVSELGTRTAAFRQSYNVHAAVVDTLQAQRESISGVSLDEEALAMMMNQQSFQAAARFIATINQLMQEMLNLI